MPNYRVLVHFDAERGLFVARAPELEHCSAEGVTRSEALAKLEEEIQAQLANMKEHGGSAPPALDEDPALSGNLSVRISRSLHRDLSWQARIEGIELDQLVSELLPVALDARRQRGRRPAQPAAMAGSGPPERRDEDAGRGGDRGRRFGPGQCGRYHAIMEDRASFLEYVRGLEQGGGPGPRREGGRRRGPGGPGGRRGPGRGSRGGPDDAGGGGGG